MDGAGGAEVGGERYGPSADVYSFGIVMWEIAAQAQPWRHVQGSFVMDQLLQRLRAGERPAVDASWPEPFVAAMRQCWDGAPAARPTFPAIMASTGGQSTD